MLNGKAAPRAAFFLLFAAAALVLFAVWNEPVRWALVRLQPLGVAALFVAACTGLGAWFARRDLLVAAAIGFGIFGAIVFVLALVHALVVWVFLAVGAAGIVMLVILSRADGEGSQHATPWHSGILRFAREDGIAILAATAVLLAPFVLAPDVSTDALEYHLLIPKLLLEQNAIRYEPLFVESNYPSLAEYDFVPLLATGGPIAAKAFHFLCALLVLGAIGRLARRAGGKPGIAAALFFMMPVAALTSGWAWNDFLFTLFVLLALDALWDERFVLAGFLFGFATWTKYTFVLAAIPFAALLLQRWRRPRDLLRFAIPAAAIAAIWMTKNAVLTGNPVYPFLFPSPYWGEAASRYFHDTLTRYEIPQWHWWTWLAFPVLLTLKPRIVDVHTGPLLLALLPLAFMRTGKSACPPLRTYAVAMTLGWLLIRTEARSLLTLFAVLCILYSRSIERLPGWRIVVAAGFAMNVAILLVMTNVITDPVRYVLGRESGPRYVVRMDPKQEVYTWLDAQPEVRGVLLVGLHGPFYLRKPAP
jgi:hypothetical protein